MSFQQEPSKDLPLLSNTDDIIARHYMIDLTCDFSSRTFSGWVIIFLEPVDSSDNVISSKQTIFNSDNLTDQKNLERKEIALTFGKDEPYFQCILDCCDINIKAVEEIIYEENRYQALLDYATNCKYNYASMNEWLVLPRQKLNFRTSDWGLFIWKTNVFTKQQFPRAVFISYSSTSKGSSVTWATDQSNKQCVFTQGAWINNRSLFPCQEPPIAMATWQACITVSDGATVIMSGDEEPLVYNKGANKKSFYFFTRMTLPMSTLALAVGFWDSIKLVSQMESDLSEKKIEIGNFQCKHDKFPCYLKSKTFPSLIPCRLFCSPHLISLAEKEFKDFIRNCLQAAFSLLGPHPFPRLEIVILPRCFGSLGLASPNVLFISQTLLVGDGSMTIRLAHEIAHSWFGLSIGALDWTEEWLSEGFATFLEDFIYSSASNSMISEIKAKEIAELRSLLRFRILQAEISNSDLELQTLRPNLGQEIKEGNVILVKNGMNPYKCFTQVHYLKGYFLLRYLSQLSGEEKFLHLLKTYVIHNHGCLVLSENIFKLYLESFPQSKISMETIYKEWLDFPGMPKTLTDYEETLENSLIGEVKQELQKWMKSKRVFNKKKSSKKLKLETNPFHQIKSDQLVLLLEYLLCESHIPNKMFEKLQEVYNIKHQNADVKHRWCELVIKHDYKKKLKDVEEFLTENQAMGVYLYGELVLSGKPHHRTLAEHCFEVLKDEMDSPVRITVHEILFGESQKET